MIKVLKLSLYDGSTLNFSIPFLNKRVGILVSGGLDSAVLYYLVRLYNKQNKNWYDITHYSIPSFDNNYAKEVISYIDQLFNVPSHSLNLIGDGELSDLERIPFAQKAILKVESVVLCGHIKVLPEHSINVTYNQNWKDGQFVKYPLKDLNKSHIIDIIYQEQIEQLFALTKSCVYNNTQPCSKCNRCLERKWAFNSLGKSEFDK